MQRAIYLFISFLLCGFLASCNGTMAVSSANEMSPILDNPLPKQNRVLVLSTLNGNVKSSRGFSDVNNYSLNMEKTNQLVSESLLNLLTARGYKTSTLVLPAFNPLNHGNIESSSAIFTAGIAQQFGNSNLLKGSLTTEAKNYLRSLLPGSHADVILLVTQQFGSETTFTIDCSGNLMSNVNYKIYVIDTHELNVLGWEAGLINFKTSACLQTHKLTDEQLNLLNQNMGNPIAKAAVDTTRTLLRL